MSEKRDEELMLEFQNGDIGAIEMIFHRYKNRILNFSLRMLANRADAEDATSETFVKLYSQKYAFRPEAKFSTWLFTVARNACIDQARKRKRTISLWFKNNKGEEQEFDLEDAKDTSREALVKKEAAREVRTCIGRLPYTQREALILREYQKFSYQDIAQILNCSLDNVKVLIFRAREQLKKELNSFIQEGAS